MTAPLDEGDLVKYGVTAQVKDKQNMDVWVRADAETTVHPGEDPADAFARLREFVEGEIVSAAKDAAE